MSDTSVRIFASADLEGEHSDDGFTEILRPALSGADGVLVARFGTSVGAGVPAHIHTANSVAFLARGRAAFLVGDNFSQRIEMKAGEYVMVPKNVPHIEETIGDEPVEFLIVRDGGGGETIYLDPPPTT